MTFKIGLTFHNSDCATTGLSSPEGSSCSQEDMEEDKENSHLQRNNTTFEETGSLKLFLGILNRQFQV